MSTVNIPFSDLENKKKQMEAQLEKIQVELGHIDWVIRNYRKVDSIPSDQKQFSKVEDLLASILTEKAPRGLSTDELLEELKNKGRDMKRGTLHAHLSRYAANSSSSIERVGVGLYSVKM